MAANRLMDGRFVMVDGDMCVCSLSSVDIFGHLPVRKKMSKHIQWIEHKGKRILHSDFSGLKGEEYVRAIDECYREILRQPADSIVLSLTDTSNSLSSSDTTAESKDWEAVVKEKGILMRVAVVGIPLWQKVAAQLIRADIYYASSVEDAKDWLVAQANR